MSRPKLVVIAKAPVAGRAKTRLCPPLSPAEAADLAAASLHDTLEAVASVPGTRHLLALDGPPGPWLPAGFNGGIARQCDGGLGDRLAGAFASAGGPALVVGSDTPQLTPAILDRALAALESPGVDAVLGPAADGGYWTLGLRRPDPRVFDGVPMSSPETGSVQLSRLLELGMRVARLEQLRDVDTIDDARAVAREFPGTRFASMFAALGIAHPYEVAASAR